MAWSKSSGIIIGLLGEELLVQTGGLGRLAGQGDHLFPTIFTCGIYLDRVRLKRHPNIDCLYLYKILLIKRLFM